MIIKQAPSRGNGSCRPLIRYISDPKNSRTRVAGVWLHNMKAGDAKDAVAEMDACAALNKGRSRKNKTMHIIVSFPDGERPSDEQIAEMQKDILKAIGMEGHQAVCAAHDDTDNFHFHMAVCRVDKNTGKAKEPYALWTKVFPDLCRKFEERYGLGATNHELKRTVSEVKAADYEIRTGEKSLATHIKEMKLEQCGSWQELADRLAEGGCIARKHGQGIIFETADGSEHVKASTAGRNLSLKKLEAKFGPMPENLGPTPAEEKAEGEKKEPEKKKISLAEYPEMPGTQGAETGRKEDKPGGKKEPEPAKNYASEPTADARIDEEVAKLHRAYLNYKKKLAERLKKEQEKAYKKAEWEENKALAKLDSLEERTEKSRLPKAVKKLVFAEIKDRRREVKKYFAEKKKKDAGGVSRSASNFKNFLVAAAGLGKKASLMAARALKKLFDAETAKRGSKTNQRQPSGGQNKRAFSERTWKSAADAAEKITRRGSLITPPPAGRGNYSGIKPDGSNQTRGRGNVGPRPARAAVYGRRDAGNGRTKPAGRNNVIARRGTAARAVFGIGAEAARRLRFVAGIAARKLADKVRSSRKSSGRMETFRGMRLHKVPERVMASLARYGKVLLRTPVHADLRKQERPRGRGHDR